MKKIVNFRPLFLSAIVMLAATLLATRIFISQGLKLTVFFVLLIAGALSLLCCVKQKKGIVAIVGAMLLLASYPFLHIFIKGETLAKYQDFNNKVVTVSGTVKGSLKTYDNGSARLLIDDAEVSYFSDHYKLKGDVYLYFSPENYNLDNFCSGTQILVKGKITTYSYQDHNISKALSNLSLNVVGYVGGSDITITMGDYKPSVAEKIKLFISNKLNALSEDYSSLAQALLFGDTNHIDAELKSSFQDTGIAHLLAVSGLHVSVVVMFIGFLMRKFKAKSSTNLVVSSMILLLYCYLCGFSVSVVRASIMAVIMGYAMFRGKAYDGLSALSLAALVTLIANPNAMYSVSFVLSYIAVFSIFCLAPPMARKLSSCFYSKFANAVSVSIAVCVGSCVALIAYFAHFPLLTILTNLLLVPIASIAFVLLIVGVVVSMVLPFATFVLTGYESVMSVVVKFNTWIDMLDLSVTVTTEGLALVLMTMTTFILSDYLFVSNKTKKVLAIGGIALVLLMLVFV